MMNWLNGNKTNLGLIAGGLLGICWSQGWIGNEMAATGASIITTWTGVSARHAFKKGR